MVRLSALLQIRESGQIVLGDVIEYQGGLWLVPHWMDGPPARQRRPARLVRLDLLPHQRLESGRPADIVVNEPVPQWVTDYRTPAGSDDRLQVIEQPDVTIEFPTVS